MKFLNKDLDTSIQCIDNLFKENSISHIDNLFNDLCDDLNIDFSKYPQDIIDFFIDNNYISYVDEYEVLIKKK